MRKVKNLRKAHFRAALAFTEQTQAEWAEAHGVPASMLSQVLDGKRTNDALLAKIEAFTKKHVSGVAAA